MIEKEIILKQGSLKIFQRNFCNSLPVFPFTENPLPLKEPNLVSILGEIPDLLTLSPNLFPRFYLVSKTKNHIYLRFLVFFFFIMALAGVGAGAQTPQVPPSLHSVYNLNNFCMPRNIQNQSSHVLHKSLR